MKRFIGLIAALAVLSFPVSASTWNARGHMVVAAIAWERMSPQARARAHELLKLNPNYLP